MLSQPASLDEAFLQRIAEIEATGAHVTIVTTERHDDVKHVVTRTATITWETHNAAAIVVPDAKPIPYQIQF